MATNLEILAKEYSRSGQPGIADSLMGLAQISRQLGIEAFPTGLKTFSDGARQALIKDGAVIYPLRGSTIETQREMQREKGKPSFYYVVNGDERLVGRPSRLSEVAIYPDPKKFFIPNTGGKDLETQEALAAEDANKLRKRLKQNGMDVVIPEQAATLTELTFKHLDETGVWLFGENYDYLFGRTKNPTNESGSVAAYVGDADPGRGLDVDDWSRGLGLDGIRVVRLVVPKD